MSTDHGEGNVEEENCRPSPFIFNETYYNCIQKGRENPAAQKKSLSETNIWKLAIKKHSTALEAEESNSVIYVLGNGNSGKSSILSTFVNRRNPICENQVGIDYSHAMLEDVDGKTKICECYELCGDAIEFKSLISHPVKSSSGLRNLTLVLVLDLTAPNKIWEVFENFTIHIKEGFEKYASSLAPENCDRMRTRLDTRMRKLGIIMDHEDLKNLDLFPLPVVVVGGKYDQFEKLDPIEKKHLARLLRIMCHKIGAALIFYSNKSREQQKRMKDLLRYYAYGTPFSHEKVTSHFEPIYINHGTDSFKDILSLNKSATDITFSSMKKNFEKRYGITCAEDRAEYDNPIMDSRYAEYEIDRRREEELTKIEIGQYAVVEESARRELRNRDNRVRQGQDRDSLFDGNYVASTSFSCRNYYL